MDWADVPGVTDGWALKAAAPAYDLRRKACSVFTAHDVGYYFDPRTEKVALFAADPAATGDLLRCKMAAERAVGADQVRPLFLTYQDLSDPDGSWVKVAFSPTLRRAGELGNFFPGQYPGGIPNAPSPLAAMLTSGLVGAGLGYGGGKLLAGLLPQKFGKKLGRTGAVLGGLIGAAPGAAWMGANALSGHAPNDPSLLNHAADEPPVEFPNAARGLVEAPLPDARELITPEAQAHLGHMFKTSMDRLMEKLADTFAGPYEMPDPTPLDVNINALGQTLWDHGASPNLAATTMGAMYAAQQLPDPRGRPGWATGNQLGHLAQNAAGDYFKGLLVGAALNKVVGTPVSAPVYGLGNMALGIIGAVVPKLFGG